MGCIVHRIAKSQTQLRGFHFLQFRGNLPTSRVAKEKAMTIYSSTLAGKVPWMEEPGRLQSTGQLGVRHDFTFTFIYWRRKWQPTPVFLPGESQGQESWWAVVYGVAQSQTRLKRLSSSSKNQLWIFFKILSQVQSTVFKTVQSLKQFLKLNNGFL